eukprot:TRINITY_DN10631_c0_g1_i1.p1 TRINITY_DN10631_c0_g1~~TRINITY_DN10631_c0_g1_i1.p1  ORF type:complete len:150 (+),score=33.06 TRINITY_DN10631_c0_g1_i1:62-511(+)
MAYAPSDDLIWQLIRNNNSFLVRRNHGSKRVEFSSEEGNLTNQNSYKYSGIANSKAVHLEENDQDGVTLSVKSNKTSKKYQPSSLYVSWALNKDTRRTAKSIKSVVDGYRPDLTKSALARMYRLKQTTAGGVKKANNRPRRRAQTVALA